MSRHREKMTDNLFFVSRNIEETGSEEVYFFNTSRFLTSRKVEGETMCFELEHANGSTLASMVIVLINNIAYSPWRAPFGSIQCFVKLDEETLGVFISGILARLSQLSVRELNITHYPEFYDSAMSKQIHREFQLFGFDNCYGEVNQHIEIDKSDFLSTISSSEKNRLKKCYNSKLSCEMESLSSLKEAYDLLEISMKRKNYPISMSYEALVDMFRIHQDNYLLFAVRDKKEMVALVVGIIVSPKILYSFYHANHPDYQHFSPILMALEGVYNFCNEKKIRFIDLGISSLDGVLNRGLYNFKKRLGAKVSHKNIYRWTPD
jgi:lipid II:glycine glycyltransferase (peptidoglycan interpeptide bridge formation enzyme)